MGSAGLGLRARSLGIFLAVLGEEACPRDFIEDIVGQVESGYFDASTRELKAGRQAVGSDGDKGASPALGQPRGETDVADVLSQ